MIARVLLDPDLDDDSRLGAVFEAVPKDRLVAPLVDCERIAPPADDSHIDLLGDHYSRLRQASPASSRCFSSAPSVTTMACWRASRCSGS